MINVSGARWMLADAGRTLRFVAARPRLVRCAFAEHPTVGVANILQVKSRNAESASLSIRQDREELFNGDIPPNAEIGVTPLTPAELVVSLTLEPRQDSATAQVVHNFRVRPKVVASVFAKLEVAREGRVGDSLAVVWETTDATSVMLQIEQGDERTEHVGASAGMFMLRPARAGSILLRLVARGAFAETVETRTVRVNVPKPRIEIDRPVQSGLPGTAVTFHWRISRAREAYIEAPLRNESHRVALEGGMVAAIEPAEEEFHLVAIGLDGNRHTERLATIPRLIGCLDEPESSTSRLWEFAP